MLIEVKTEGIANNVTIKPKGFSPLQSLMDTIKVYRGGKMPGVEMLRILVKSLEGWDSRDLILHLTEDEFQKAIKFLKNSRLALMELARIDEPLFISIAADTQWLGQDQFGDVLRLVKPLDLLLFWFLHPSKLPVNREEVILCVTVRDNERGRRTGLTITDRVGNRESRLLFLLLIAVIAFPRKRPKLVAAIHEELSKASEVWHRLFLANAVCPVMYEAGKQETNGIWLHRMEGLRSLLAMAQKHAEDSKADVKSPHVAEAKKILEGVTEVLSADNVAGEFDRLLGQELGQEPILERVPLEASEDLSPSDQPG